MLGQSLVPNLYLPAEAPVTSNEGNWARSWISGDVCVAHFSKNNAKLTLWCPFLQEPSEKSLAVTQKCAFCRTVCLRKKKKWEKSSRKKRRKKLVLQRADSGGSSLVSHQTVSDCRSGSAATVCSKQGDQREIQLLCKCVVGEGIFFFFF